ncbi:TerB family tellurite resistance protein [Azospirillum halopraeferens]|uniref:tellurite resistance TerB family protein n=1 Tax=Azospirillum halopraeferens TaxID=34010 RepID=UPI00041817D4|nr:TerB family tellurite resistance protein [Azospirillum halopraeferens]
MLNRIRALFEDWDGTPEDRRRTTHGQDELQLAAAALLVEAARTDNGIRPEERARIVAVVRRRFSLNDAEATELMHAAETETEGTAHHYNYVRTIIDHCPPEERLWIIEMLWEVAYADGHLNDLEANLLRRLAGMLAVPDREAGAARLRVAERLGVQ